MRAVRIDSFSDPLGMMMDQSRWAFERSIINGENPISEKFWKLHLFWEQGIKKYLEESPAF